MARCAPADRAIVLWECFLEERYREDDPLADIAFREIWRGFEQALIARSPAALRIITTWEDSYERTAWRRFLASRGYRQNDQAVFAKVVE